ncbi:MAG: hypothetical protein MZV70_43280 [Desulfobacterales bacterium]|nr:hypothetical protein [Desulfobacterales bacterium]
MKAFSQPYPALDSYEPPSGDLRPWPGSAGAGGEIVPLDRSDGRLVYHPFYAVTMGATGEGLLLDGVSGGVVGAEGTVGAPPAEEPRRVFFDSLLVAVVPSALLYLVFHRVSPVLAVLLSSACGLSRR